MGILSCLTYIICQIGRIYRSAAAEGRVLERLISDDAVVPASQPEVVPAHVRTPNATDLDVAEVVKQGASSPSGGAQRNGCYPMQASPSPFPGRSFFSLQRLSQSATRVSSRYCCVAVLARGATRQARSPTTCHELKTLTAARFNASCHLNSR